VIGKQRRTSAAPDSLRSGVISAFSFGGGAWVVGAVVLSSLTGEQSVRVRHEAVSIAVTQEEILM